MSSESFEVGQRVRTTVDAPAAWEGAFSAPAGSLGVITGPPGQYSPDYGVLVDGDETPAAYHPSELTAV